MKKKNKQQEKSRKGLSPVVSTIILIMIVLVIAIIIILWFKVFLKEAVLKEVGGTSKRAEDFCNDLQFKAALDPDGSVVVTNQGNVPIHAFLIKTFSADGSSDTTTKTMDLNPGYSQTIPPTQFAIGYTELKITPILLGKTKANLLKPVTCPEKYAVKL